MMISLTKLGDLLDGLRTLFNEPRQDDIEEYFGCAVDSILTESSEDTRTMKIFFPNNLLVNAEYYVKLRDENIECMLQKEVDIVDTGFDYDIMGNRVWIDHPNKVIGRLLRREYKVHLANAYEPLMPNLKGIFKKDYFGIHAFQRAYVYYSPVRKGKEEENAILSDVLMRFNEIEEMLSDEPMKKNLSDLRERFNSLKQSILLS